MEMLQEYHVKVYNEITHKVIDDFFMSAHNEDELDVIMACELYNYNEPYDELTYIAC